MKNHLSVRKEHFKRKMNAKGGLAMGRKYLAVIVTALLLGILSGYAEAFDFNSSNEGWRRVGLYDGGSLNQVPGAFSNDPAPHTMIDGNPAAGAIGLGSGGFSFPGSPSGATWIHWDLNSPNISANPLWQGITSYSYSVTGKYIATAGSNIYVQALLHVRKPDNTVLFYHDEKFHHICSADNSSCTPSWKTHTVDVASFGMPAGTTILDVNLRIFFRAGSGHDGYVLVDHVVPVGGGGGAAAFCTQYASTAVAQNQENIDNGCGYTGGRWQSNYNNHYAWCMVVPQSAATSEENARESGLDQCLKDNFCDEYATTAVAQNNENLSRNCGYTGGRWQSNYNNHYTWCMAVPQSSATSEENARDYGLDTCSDHDDVIIDFGSAYGVWTRYNDVSWKKLYSRSPDTTATGDLDGSGKDDVIMDLGSDGIWVIYDDNPATLRKVGYLSPESMVTGDIDGSGKDDLIVDMGTHGIWAFYNNDYSTWKKIGALSPDTMAIGDLDGSGRDDLIVDMGTHGIWIFYDNDDTRWVKLNPVSPDTMVTGDIDGNGKDDLIIDFGTAYGIYIRYNNAVWKKLISISPEAMVTGDMNGNGQDEVIIDFGPTYGIWVRYDNASWKRLNSISPESIVTGDMNGNGKDDVIIDFGTTYGIWVRYDDVSWKQLHSVSPETMVTGNIDGK